MLSFVKLRKNSPRLSFWAFVVTLGSFAPGKPREGSRSAHFHGKGKFFIRDAQERRRLLKVTLPASFANSLLESNGFYAASCSGLEFHCPAWLKCSNRAFGSEL